VISAAGVYTAKIATPFAVIGICVRDEKLRYVQYLAPCTPTLRPCDALSREVCRQIRAYLANPLHDFDLPYALEGTQFQRGVWREIARIPARATRSYGDLARVLHSAPRAVGQACGSNPVPLIVPCHRVVAANGRLGGFMHSSADFSLGVKRWLLSHEGH
jgi:methylated-DNA-[protein]-cysteine S-methyltransferase